MSKTIPRLDLSTVGRMNLYRSDERRLNDDAISSTKEALQCMRAEDRAVILCKESLQSDLDRYLIARAPIEYLPDDLLCNIFEVHCQDPPPVEIPLFIPPQITISHVCSTWRQLMLDIPAFWYSIRLKFDLAQNNERKMDIAHAWLSRVKSLPCSVKFIFRNSRWFEHDRCQLDWHRNTVNDIISLFKLKKLDLTFENYRLRDLLRLPDEKLCCIENLCLSEMNIKDSTTNEAVLPFELHKLSSLVSFSLFKTLSSHFSGIAPEDGSRFASMPWRQLRHIKISRMFPILFCLRMLELSSVVLETCLLGIYVDSTFMSLPPSSLKPVHCNQLREFTVIHSPLIINSMPEADDIIDPLLGSLRCPKLKSLTVGANTGFILPRSINLQTFLWMQHVSRMHLEELMIYDTAHDLEVLPLLTCFPSLRRLVLPHMINFTEEAMDELGSGSIAPFLENLTIKKSTLAFEKLCEKIKLRSSVGKEDITRKYKLTPFKSVMLCCEGWERWEYTDTI